jgi:hypothetical protein
MIIVSKNHDKRNPHSLIADLLLWLLELAGSKEDINIAT